MGRVKQIIGFVLILSVILLNFVFVLVCMHYTNNCEMLDTYSWGFLNAVLIMVGLINLGG